MVAKKKPSKKKPVKKKAAKKNLVKTKAAKKPSKVKPVKKKAVKIKPVKKKPAKPLKKPVEKKQPEKPPEPAPEPLTIKLHKEPREAIRVYGHKVSPAKIQKAAQKAVYGRGISVNDISVSEFIRDDKYDNLMIKIALLDRIEEELLRTIDEQHIQRVNTIEIRIV
ncbi:MAG TPA: hypothetical protein ENN13_05320 [Candidatus Altiarchaeales archaeon]|nr:hypothetical protein [Candidatus Altiarchaeales archaeon]